MYFVIALNGHPKVLDTNSNNQTSKYSFHINQTTRCNNFSSLLLDVYVQLNIVGPGVGNPIPHNRPDHDQQHFYHHAPTVKPEAATAVVELLMMGVRTSETC